MGLMQTPSVNLAVWMRCLKMLSPVSAEDRGDDFEDVASSGNAVKNEDEPARMGFLVTFLGHPVTSGWIPNLLRGHLHGNWADVC